MPSVDRSILVKAAIDRVFEFVADYRNTTSYQRQFTTFDPIGDTRHGLGLTVDARGRFKGWPIHTRLRITKFVENEVIVSRSIAGLKSSAEWTFSREDVGTRVRFRATYGWPVPILSSIIRKVLKAELESVTENSLRELKRLVEAEKPPPSS